MKKFGLQLYTIRDRFQTEEDIRSSFRTIAEYGYTEGQTAGAFINPESFAAAAKDAGVSICGTHYSWDKIRYELDDTMRIHELLGTTNVGIGGMPADARESVEGLKKFIDEANDVAAKLAKQGFKFTYHNHSFEFKKFDGKTIFDYLVEGLDPDNTSFVLDTYWVQHGGADVRATIERLAGRIEILHLKDMEACHAYATADGKSIAAPAIIEIGEGNINFKGIIPLAEKCGVKYFVVEDDRAPSVGSYTAVKKSADYIKANLLEA